MKQNVVAKAAKQLITFIGGSLELESKELNWQCSVVNEIHEKRSCLHLNLKKRPKSNEDFHCRIGAWYHKTIT